jgi:MSHA biogenesis protein MshN
MDGICFMSVVNKMLQDLEARQSQTDELNADYQPPPKKPSKPWVLVLLALAITAIIFTLINKSQLFNKSQNAQMMTSVNSQPVVVAEANKMLAAPKKAQPQVLPQSTSSQPSKANIEVVNTAVNMTLASNLVTEEIASPDKPKMAADNLTSLKNIETQDEQVETKNTLPLDTQTTAQQISSFSMSDSSQDNNASSLKQRIAESLNNDNFDLAQSLLSELLATEPQNIKARKKSASLLFAQGNYSQSRQLLIQGIELHPTKGDLRLMLARLYVVQKEPSKAMDLLAEFYPSSNNQTEYLSYRAALAQQLKQTELANSDYQTLTNIESANAKWWLGLAITRDQLGEINKALQAYNKANSLGQLDASVNDFIQQRISVLTGAQ